MDTIPISQILGKERLVEMSLGNSLGPRSHA